MNLSFYNTLTKKNQVFEPLDEKDVVMYVCGPTVYDDPHLGHARAAVVFDVLFRVLQQRYGHESVRYIRNYTDVDDKIIARANERGVSIDAINEQYIASYEEAVDALGCLRPTLSPRVTDVMQEIIEYVQKLIESGAAYEANGCVYFDVRAFADYGKLSNRTVDEIATIHRVESDPDKREALDFALWKTAKPGEPSWDSPWGAGRPGWHIECTVMATFFGRQTLDIHGGGLDLIFPHHENEVAQCEALTHEPFARYWIHNGFVQINEEKMSKSLGNFKTVNEMLNVWPAECLRYFLLSAHYRTPLDFTLQGLAEAAKAIQRLYSGFEIVQHASFSTELELSDKQRKKIKGLSETIHAARENFDRSISDDINSAKGLGSIFEVIREVNKVLQPFRGEFPDEVKKSIDQVLDLHERLRSTLGLATGSSGSFTDTWNEKACRVLAIEASEIVSKIDARNAARIAKDWAQADEVRDALVAMGVVLEDADAETAWRIDPDAVVARLREA